MAVYILVDDEAKKKRIKKSLNSSNIKEIRDKDEGIRLIQQENKPSLVIAEAPLDKKFVEQAKENSPYVDFILLTETEEESCDDATFVCDKDCDEKIAEKVNAPVSRLNLIEQIYSDTEDLKEKVTRFSRKARGRNDS